MTTYPITDGADGNTWHSSDVKRTIDYILAMGRGGFDVDFKDVLVKDLKTTINNVSLSNHNSVLAKVKLGCTIKN